MLPHFFDRSSRQASRPRFNGKARLQPRQRGRDRTLKFAARLEYLEARRLLSAAPGDAPITGLFNTGVDNTGALLAGGAVDPHYKLISSADQTAPGPNAYIETGAPVSPAGPWVAAGPQSEWVVPSLPNSANAQPGYYTYETTFDLTGFDPNTAHIDGQWAADELGTKILINGVNSVSVELPPVNGYIAYQPFHINAGFLPGLNTIDFVVQNTGDAPNPTGLRVEMTGHATAGRIIDIDTQQLTISGDDADAHAIYGVPFTASVVNGLAQFDIAGDLTLQPGDIVIATGGLPVSLQVANDVNIPAGAMIDVSGESFSPGPGGGAGGGAGDGGNGGTGGGGGSGGGGGPGGAGGGWPFGGSQPGGSGSEGAAGTDGQIGLAGTPGASGAEGYGDTVSGGSGGASTTLGAFGIHGADGGSPGGGGSKGAGDGGNAGAGALGTGGGSLDGTKGGAGAPGTNTGAGIAISGGGGGGGGAGGAGGGGGGGGAGGGGGGGGGGGSGGLFNSGGNGTPGETGGTGGSGGAGGPGNDGGSGGGGGGAIEIVARGRVTIAGTLVAAGGAGGAGDPVAVAGEKGAAGISPPHLINLGNGGFGGFGGAGGAGGDGGAGGAGGDGSGGAGGTIKIVGSAVTSSATAVVDVAGGDASGKAGQAGGVGRFLVGANTGTSFTGTVTSGATTTFAGPEAANPFVAGQPLTPYLPGLVGGADVYGLAGVNAGNLSQLLADAPSGSPAALLLADGGVPGFNDSFPGYDLLLLVNLTAQSMGNPDLSVGESTFKKPLLQGGFKNNPAYGGSGPQPIAELGGYQVYAMLVPINSVDFNVSFIEGTYYTASAPILTTDSPFFVPAPQAPAPFTATAAGALTAVQGSDSTFNVATFSGPPVSLTINSYFATIDWGDGQTSAGTISNEDANGFYTVTGSHTYTEESVNPKTVTVVIDDFVLTMVAKELTVTDPLTIADAPRTAPTIISADATTFTVATSGTFEVVSGGTPTAKLTETGTLPANVTFVDNGDGTATLSGAPAAGTAARREPTH